MKSILVIDDDPVVRERIRTQLEAAGYRVSTADDGEAAVALVRRQSVDLVILDVMMPRKGGVETLVEITQILDRRPATIVITALENAESEVFRNIVDKFGVHHVFRKPVQHEQLISTVRQLIPPE